MSDRDTELGYTCACGEFHEAGTWGAAHWDMELVHTCTGCGRRNLIQSGECLGEFKSQSERLL